MCVQVDAVVVGDICCMEYGELVPADGILISSNDCTVASIRYTDTADGKCSAEETGLKKFGYYDKFGFSATGETSDCWLFGNTRVIQGEGLMLVLRVGSDTWVNQTRNECIARGQSVFGQCEPILEGFNPTKTIAE